MKSHFRTLWQTAAFTATLLTILPQSLFAQGFPTVKRGVLLGIDKAKHQEPEKLLYSIHYITTLLSLNTCTAGANYRVIPVKNHNWDWPNSNKYVGFATVSFAQRLDLECDEWFAKFKDVFASIGLDPLAMTNIPQSQTERVIVDVNSETFSCGNRPHFPTGYDLKYRGIRFDAYIHDECKLFNETLALAASNGGKLDGVLETETKSEISFDNTGNTQPDNRLRWKLRDFQSYRLKLQNGLIFEGITVKTEEIPHD